MSAMGSTRIWASPKRTGWKTSAASARVARLMAEAGLIVLVSFISPFRNERRLAREIAGDVQFHRSLCRYPARGMRGPRSQGPLCPGPPWRDQEFYRHRQPVRAAGTSRCGAARGRQAAAGPRRRTLCPAVRDGWRLLDLSDAGPGGRSLCPPLCRARQQNVGGAADRFDRHRNPAANRSICGKKKPFQSMGNRLLTRRGRN